jgi:hypothetical protein
MGYWILTGLMAVWTFFDARQRHLGRTDLGWTLGALLMPFLALPLYLAFRPLKAGETRRGGKLWVVLKGFAVAWTALMLAVEISLGLELAAGLAAQTTAADRNSYGFGSVLALGLVAIYWLLPLVAALVIGLLLKKRSAVEHGPTGRLAMA